jgi:hypothetical protein
MNAKFHVTNEHVLRGNHAVLSCQSPYESRELTVPQQHNELDFYSSVNNTGQIVIASRTEFPNNLVTSPLAIYATFVCLFSATH